MGSSLRFSPILYCNALLAVAALTGAGCAGGRAMPEGPVIYAAASLRDVAGELASSFERHAGAAVELNLAGSNTLAQQILATPGADVFLSADRHWVEVLEEAGRVVGGSRRALLSNRLVLIAGSDSQIAVGELGELAGAGFRHLALADPDAVPAGRYARAALEQMALDGGTLWQAVAERVAPALDVRAALALVESDPAIVGIVYRTDAHQSQRVRVLHELPAGGAARVTYYGALIEEGTSPELGSRFLDFVVGAEGRRITRRHGFGEPES